MCFIVKSSCIRLLPDPFDIVLRVRHIGEVMSFATGITTCSAARRAQFCVDDHGPAFGLQGLSVLFAGSPDENGSDGQEA